MDIFRAQHIAIVNWEEASQEGCSKGEELWLGLGMFYLGIYTLLPKEPFPSCLGKVPLPYGRAAPPLSF